MENKDVLHFIDTYVSRRGPTDKLKQFLSESDFYTAPCSTKFHLAKPGGLALHTVNVMACALNFAQYYKEEHKLSEESAVIAALCHDFCKINFYKEVDDPATDAQIKYLKGLLFTNSFVMPPKMNKAYASTLIDFLLHKFKKGMALPPYTPCYQPNDQLPLGHGEKSMMIASKYIDLTEEEMLAIRWHMATFDPSIHFDYPNGFAYREALKKSKLVSILVLADFEATNLLED